MDTATIQRFSKPDQILHVAAELTRAAGWQDDRETFSACIRRALDLVRAIEGDPKWNDNPDLLASLKESIEDVNSGKESVEEILKVL